jgi:exodeoxyribonuclease V alpha subunit
MILDPDQQKVIDNFQSNNITIISGPPGSGKTACIRTICDVLDTASEKYVLAGPTGKSAKRLQELTGKEAKTIHRLLKAGYGHWSYNANNKMSDIDFVVVDECSMCDLELMWHLLQSFPSTTKFVFSGDINQLPSVGPGTVLRDMVNSKLIPTYYLTYNHRQLKGSLITHNAGIINKGGLKLTFGDDIKFIEANNPIEIREFLPKLVAELENDGYNNIEEIQVLSPQHSTPIGVSALNEMLRFIINPRSKPSEKFSVGDKVMQTTNNYELKIFNGYIGQILGQTSYDYAIKFFDVDKDTVIKYPKQNSYELMLAYVATIHKFQGSEVKAGIIILSSSHTFMWSRCLLYTAITRYKEKCIILGDAATFRKAITNTAEQTRYSKLYERLKGLL